MEARSTAKSSLSMPAATDKSTAIIDVIEIDDGDEEVSLKKSLSASKSNDIAEDANINVEKEAL